MTEWLHFHFSLSCIGAGNGNPLQCSCLENPRDRGAWWAAIYGVAQSRTWLKWLSSSSTQSLSFQFVCCQNWQDRQLVIQKEQEQRQLFEKEQKFEWYLESWAKLINKVNLLYKAILLKLRDCLFYLIHRNQHKNSSKINNQENTWQTKQNSTSQHNEMVTGDLPNREFKIVVIKVPTRSQEQHKNKDNSQQR